MPVVGGELYGERSRLASDLSWRDRMSADTGPSLTAAILANPDDDAPWLVYADWLQETGHEARATLIRRHLPTVRAAVRDGHELAIVLGAIGNHPPGTPLWDEAFGRPPEPPEPPPTVASAGPAATPVRHWRPWPVVLGVLITGAVGLVGLVRKPKKLDLGGDSAVRLPSDKETDALLQSAEDGTADEAIQRAAGIKDPQPPIRSQAWTRAEVDGYWFRQEGDRPARVFDFRADGTVSMVESPPGGISMFRDGRWTVDDLGVLEVTGLGTDRPIRLVKTGVTGNRYEVSRSRVAEVYIRHDPPAR